MVVLMSRCTAHRWWCGRPPISSNGLSAHQYGQLGISQFMLQILDLMSCDSLDRNLSASVKGSTPPSGDGGAGGDCIAEMSSFALAVSYQRAMMGIKTSALEPQIATSNFFCACCCLLIAGDDMDKSDR